MYKRIYLCLLFVILAGLPSSFSRNPVGLQQTFRNFAADESLGNSSWSIEVIEASTGRSILSHNSNISLVPASTQKIVTTASALLLLGSEFRYSTTLVARGVIDNNGVLHGDLVIKGSGDPTLGAQQMADSLSLDKVFLQWLGDMHSKGIRRITGKIIADDSVFDREMVPRKWIWEDIGNYYGAGSSGLTVHENMYTVFFQAGPRPGDPVKVLGTEPVIAGMFLENQVRTGAAGSGDQVYIFGAPYSSNRVLTGTVPAGSNRFPVRGSMPDPPSYLAQAFDHYLQQSGITTSGNVLSWPEALTMPAAVATPTLTISTWWSPPLKEIARRTNISSVNTYAENLLKTIGYAINGAGTTASGTDAIYSAWTDAGIDMRGMRLHDGSGLSPSNRLTTGQLASMLAFFSRHPSFEDLKLGLPVAGLSGSLENHFRNTASRGVLIAKSGFLGNVRSYAGYTTTKDGTLVAFAFIVNDYHGSPAVMRSKMFELMNAITLHEQSKP